MSKNYKVSWLDSSKQPSARHLTLDKLITLCGHNFNQMFDNNTWEYYKSPAKKQGRSNFCIVCFTQGNKNSKWLKDD